LEANFARIRWWHGLMESHVSKANMDHIDLVDRSFAPGDIVSSCLNRSAQMGTVYGLHVNITAYFFKTKLTAASDAADFVHLHPFKQRTAIVNFCPADPPEKIWYHAIGHILDCAWDLVVRFKDGSQCVVMDAKPDELIPDEIMESIDDEVPFWPGQAVVDPKNKVFKNSLYISGGWKKSHVAQGGVVRCIVPTKVQVRLATRNTRLDDLLLTNKECFREEDGTVWVHPSKLTVFETFAACELRLAQMAFLSPLSKRPRVCSMTNPTHAIHFYGPRLNTTKEGREEFYRQQVQGSEGNNGTDMEAQVGWIVDIKTSADVMWQDGTLESGVPGTTLFSRQYVQDFDAFPGDAVRRAASSLLKPSEQVGFVQAMDGAQRTVFVQWTKDTPTEELSAYDLASAAREDIVIGDTVLYLPLETASTIRQALHPELASEPPQVVSLGLCDSPLDVVPDVAAVGQLLAIDASGLWTVLWADGTESAVDRMQLVSIPDVLNDGDSSESEDEWDSDSSDDDEAEEPGEDNDPISMEVDAAQVPAPDRSPRPPGASVLRSGLDVLDGPFDSHHFGSDEGLRPTKGLLRRVQEEWRTLSGSLPEDGLRVKVTLTNIQLMKVLIAGASHTPYAHAIFAFDVLLPNDFPEAPPKMHFHSYGLRLNPNLSHKDGSICLSLLNTWPSPYRQEMWSPGCSLLQVLLSLQSLVLCAEPYYNEGAYDRHAGADRHSRGYNELVLLTKVEYLVAMAQRPPADWATEVPEYLRHSIPLALEALEAYGPAGEEEVPSERCDAEGLFPPPTSGFRASLRRVLPHLRAALPALSPDAER